MRAARPCRAFTDLCPNLVHPRSDIGMTIGEGSFAHVKASRNIRTGTAVAIKVVDKMCRRFDPKLLRSEIDTMMHCDHPNCVTLFQVFDEPEKTYMVMELMTGGNVMDRIVELDHCSEELTCHVVTQTLSALRHLHGLGITHRDLKPENLLYASADPNSESYNTIKLADFGLARIMEDGCLKTMCGTPAYVAPEVLFQSVKKNGYHHEVDLWSLGVVVYVMLSGFLPFSHDSKPALFELIKNSDFDFPSPWWDEVSRDATDFVNGLLVVDPAERFTIDQCLRHEWLKSGGAPRKSTSQFPPCLFAAAQPQDFREHRALVPARFGWETPQHCHRSRRVHSARRRGWRFNVFHQKRLGSSAIQRLADRQAVYGRFFWGDRLNHVADPHCGPRVCGCLCGGEARSRGIVAAGTI